MNNKVAGIGIFIAAVAASNYWLMHRPVAVDVASATSTRLQVTILATGQVHTPATVTINSEIAGVVRQLAAEGQQLTQGELIARIDDKDADSTAQLAQAGVKAAELRLERLQQIDRPQAALKLEQARLLLAQAKRQLDHNRTLAQQQQTSAENLALAEEAYAARQNELALAELQVKTLTSQGLEQASARTQLQQAQAQLAQAKVRLQRQDIRSPFALTILEHKAQIGQYLKQGEAVATVLPPGQQEIIARLDERWLPQLSLHQVATVVADAFPQQKFPAYISYISPAVNDTRGTVEVRLRSNNWPAVIAEGMTVSIELLCQNHENTLVIDNTLLQQNQAQYWVWLVKDGKAYQQNIDIGQRSHEQVQVLNGLNAKDLLIKTDKALHNGQAVSIHPMKES